MGMDSSTPRTRRALLVGAVGGLAALVANAFGRPEAADASHQDAVRLSHTNFADDTTTIVAEGNRTAFAADAYHGTGVFGGSTGVGSTESGVFGKSAEGRGVFGWSLRRGPGVYGLGSSGVGVRGHSESNHGVHGTSESGYGVHGHSPTNYGVYGTSDSSYAVTGLSSTSAGVAGFSDTGQGVVGASNTIGVLGQSGSGRGGRFSGGRAAIRLDPSRAATHPASGAKGDLFVDRSARLWFCKGGTRWVQLA